jgi:hypothetical protein
MAEKSDSGIIYERARSGAVGAVVVGFALLAFAIVVLTQDGIGGIAFSADLRTMAVYLALPLAVALFLGHAHHAVLRGPTVIAAKDGLTVLFTKPPVGPIGWAEIKRVVPFRSNGRPCVGLVLEDPAHTRLIHRQSLAPLLRVARRKKPHLGIQAKMLNDPLPTVIRDLEEMRQRYSWRRT